MTVTTMKHWRALVLSLPARHGTTRMRVWRALKEAGRAGAARRGLRPAARRPRGSPVLASMEAEIQAAGGFAMTVELQLKTARAALPHVRKLFDRSARIRCADRKVDARQEGVAALGTARRRPRCQRLAARVSRKLAGNRFLPGARRQACRRRAPCRRCGRHLREALSRSGEPQPRRGAPAPGSEPRRYQQRASGRRARTCWVDRLASAWLIRRFIDPRRARFVWLERPRDRPQRAVGFDFDGAEFTHIGNRVRPSRCC